MFFAQYLTQCSWKFLAKSDIYDIYGRVDNAEIVVAIDSTVSLESLSRNKRTAIFSNREHIVQDTTRRFRWPLDLSTTGLFWTNSLDIQEFDRIMHYLRNVADDEWFDLLEKYKKI